jgi:NAD(P)-dependent dehydrogenase (short-subunit alcohol dehydrogenase family)
VLISGGSRGLGLELAREFARHGARLSLLARDEAELERAKTELQQLGAEVLVWRCDVRNPDDVATAVGRVLDIRKRIDVLVNVAGVIQVGPMEHMTDDDFVNAMAVHFWGPLHLSREVIPAMRRGGRIVNISSIGGLVAVPHLLPYVASKFALTGLSDGMRAELSRRGIRVTTVCPGLMRTGSHVNARVKGQHEEEFAWFALGSGLPLFSTTSTSAARKIVSACRYGDPTLIITPQARLLHLFNSIAPNSSAGIISWTARMLPSPTSREGNREQAGHESASPIVPSILTRLADRVVRRNNELTDDAAEDYFQAKSRPADGPST